MKVGDAQIVVPENERWSRGNRLFVIFDCLIERALVKIQTAQQMIGEDIVRLGREQALEFVARLLAAAFALVNQRQQQPLIGECVAQEHPALGAEFILIAGRAATAGASN